ncbi:MAG: long-chain-fatty-acid--CoA ligase [Mycobacterium sp.]|jgi:long-chain acyl-CoA synthetase|uniref:AMP-binding protein n=1 Tax=Mycobacterium sp. TaxID=1785 RepID=UPI00260FFD42|nr:AMP-binding protein [Mycobacterium sp.]MCW2660889.1 long-chain-fatty-acid--CoA ligase [Mycobacterium sp.]
MTNLSLYLVESADMYPDGPALRCDGATTTFTELADNAARFAAYLGDRGLRPGDRVGVMLANRPEFAMVFYGVLHAGAVVVPMDPMRSAREVEFFLTNTGARLLVFAPSCGVAATAGALAAGVPPIVVGEHTLEQLTRDFLGHASPVTRASDDNAVILHTPGTTGAPKGAQLTHSNLVSTQAVIARRLLNIGPDDVVMGCVPLSHAFGMTCGLAAVISTGATLALLPKFDPGRALEMVAAERVTVFAGLATIYTAMLGAAAGQDPDLGSLRLCISADAPMPLEVLRRFEGKFDCTVLEGYALPETSGAACFNHPGAMRKGGSIGVPIDGVQMRVVDQHASEVPTGAPGEIQVRGHNVMKGYWNLREATAEAIVDGWFSTGDSGSVDEDGYFFIVARKNI